MHYSKPNQPLKEERVQRELNNIEVMKPRDIAEMIVEMRLQLYLEQNNSKWLDALAMLLREEPIVFHEDEDGYEDTDNPLHESELYELHEKEHKRLIKIWHEDESA